MTRRFADLGAGRIGQVRARAIKSVAGTEPVAAAKSAQEKFGWAVRSIDEVRVADNPGRCEQGTGEMNWPAIARAVDAMGYAGPEGIDAFAKGKPEDALDAFRSAFTL